MGSFSSTIKYEPERGKASAAMKLPSVNQASENEGAFIFCPLKPHIAVSSFVDIFAAFV